METYITSLYGSRISPIYNEERFHDGIDIYGEVGQNVVAVYDGVVIESKYSDSYGNMLKYRLNGFKKEVVVLYAHLDKVVVKVGDKVKKGEVVAKCGKTGKVTGAHLHYSIFVDGESIDPISLVKLEKINGLE